MHYVVVYGLLVCIVSAHPCIVSARVHDFHIEAVIY